MSAPVTTPTLSMQSFFSTTLSAPISSSDTVIPLNAVPTGTEGFLVLDQDNASKEVIYFNTKGGSSVTVPSVSTGRGQGGTSATSHLSSATVKMNLVDQYWSELQNGHALGLLSVNNSKLAADISPVKFSNPYKFSVYRTAALNSSNTETVVAFDTKVFDTGSNVDVVTNKGRFTAPVAGFYQFNATVGNVSAVSTAIYTVLFVNGVRKKIGSLTTSTLAPNFSHISVLYQLAANDYAEIAFCGGAGSAINVDAVDCWFDGFLVSTL